MSLLNYFFPRKITYSDSRYNQDIVVIDYGISATLMSENLIESGSIMAQVWGAGLKKLLPKSFSPQSVLLLGLGGGSNACLISKKFPHAKIVGVDIDKVMVEIGKKHFGLSKIKNLALVIADAYKYMNNLKPEEKYDLVLLDCFIGENIPLKFEDPAFLQSLKDHSRFVLINRLWWYEHKKKTLSFMKKLSENFFFVKIHTRTNTIISLV